MKQLFTLPLLLGLGILPAAAAGRVVAHFADNAVTLGTANAQVRVEFAGASGRPPVVTASHTVVYRNAWPGIEAQYSPYRQTWKSEYHVAPGADPALIHLRYSGDGAPAIQGDGSLMLGPDFIESPPYAYQDLEGRVRVPAEYRVYPDGTVGFALGSYDRSRPLVIDPVINYSTFFGGTGETAVTSVAFDSYGNAIIAGYTTAADLPANGAKTKIAGSVDAFVAKVSGEGNKIVWCTYLGGSGDDRAYGVAVDPSNNVYVTGETHSTNFPLVGAIQTKLTGSRSVFVTKLNSTGTTILYSTYLGGTNYDQANAIAVDSTGAAYITGDAYSANFPLVNPYQSTYGGDEDAFVAKLNPAGSALVFSTYLGASGPDHGAAITLDASGNIYVTGATYSSNFPVTSSAIQPRIGGGQDAFLAEMNSSGNLTFSTFIGGSGGTTGLPESGNAVAVDSSGNVYVAGSTSSINFPTTSGAYQTTYENAGAEDHGFAWKMNSSKHLVYSTYLAGMSLDVVNALAVDPAGNAYLVGATSSNDFPIVRAFQNSLPGVTNAFILKLNSTGTALIFGSFLGGSSSDTAYGVAVDGRQNIVVAGLAQSFDFPIVHAAQSYSNGPFSGFVTRVIVGWYPINFLNGVWYLDTWRDGGYDGSTWNLTTYLYGETGDIPIVGDWTNSGHTNIGVFRCPASGLCTWILDTNGDGIIDSGDRQFNFGYLGDVPVVGDWDGTGITKAGVFRNGLWILDETGLITGVATGKSDLQFYWGMTGDKPVVGDWNGSGFTKVGIVRAGQWNLDYTGTHSLTQDLIFIYGPSGATPIVGDWDGSATAKAGVSNGGDFELNIEGTNAFKTGIDDTFWFGNSTFMMLMGH